VFLAPDGNRLKDLEQAVRQFLAWKSIWEEREALNLDPFQSRQAETKRRSADETVDARIPETYQWLLVPGQTDPKGSVEWNEIANKARIRLLSVLEEVEEREMLLVQLVVQGFDMNLIAFHSGVATTLASSNYRRFRNLSVSASPA